MLTSSHSTCSATQHNLNYPQEEEHRISKDFLHSHQLSTYSSLPESTRDVEVTPTWPSICLTQFEDTAPKAFCSPHCYNHKSCHLVVGFQLIKSMFQDFWRSGEMIKLPCYSREETKDMLSRMYWEVRIFWKEPVLHLRAFLRSSLRGRCREAETWATAIHAEFMNSWIHAMAFSTFGHTKTTVVNSKSAAIMDRCLSGEQRLKLKG